MVYVQIGRAEPEPRGLSVEGVLLASVSYEPTVANGRGRQQSAGVVCALSGRVPFLCSCTAMGRGWLLNAEQ